MKEHQIGETYRLNINGAYYRATLVSINRDVTPHKGHVIIQEHSVYSFLGISTIRKRHKQRSEAVPCTDVPLSKLQ